jgi:predicted adenine nucleotide alpha hydrolase (AANH) superfamily ATPase
MKKADYQKELDTLIEQIKIEQKTPRLFLHSCCAPCSSHCLTYLADFFDITVFFYNPNITELAEYNKRLAEQERLLKELPLPGKVSLLPGDYEPECFFEIAKGLENLPEGAERCHRCYELRLRETARKALENKADFFGTTLSVSPYKNATALYEIGKKLEAEMGIAFLPADFKKRGGYLHSIELSREYDLYRQPYCGCIYSLEQAKNKNRM